MDNIISVNSIVKTYPIRKSREKLKAVENISFDVYRGEVLGLLGHNGAGKTTTIKMICGLLKPDSGTVTINGIDNQKRRHQALQHISAVLEGNRNLYWRLTVRENLEYFAGNRGFSRKEIAPYVDDLLEKFKLKTKEKELVNGLSRGMQQKLAIAVAMVAQSEVILLDEPTLGLDVETGYEVRELLRYIAKEENRTIIVSTHDMPVVQDLCDRAVIINNGRVIIDDQVANLMKIFNTTAYSITVNQELTQDQQVKLSQTFPVIHYEFEAKQGVIKVNLSRSDDFYTLMDILKLNRTPVASIDKASVDFEKVFLHLIKEGKSYEMAQSS